MSHHSQEAHVPVLSASLHDIRYFTALLRGVSFSPKATVTITERGLTVTVEDARTLLGTAFIFAGIFDEYAYNPEAPQPGAPSLKRRSRHKQKRKAPQKRPLNPDDSSETESDSHSENNQDSAYDPAANSDEDDADENPENAAFEIPINTLIECLNIFGTAGPSTGSVTSSTNGGRGQGTGRGRGAPGGWRGAPDREDNDDSDVGDGRGGTLRPLFGGAEGKTGLRLSYMGTGYPLTLIIAEEALGPTTTCEITTFEAEPHLSLDYDNSKTVLKIILKSSWLRDALSEIDPSCEKLTLVGNPPTSSMTSDAQRKDTKGKQRQRQGNPAPTRPMMRIQASGVFGSTEMDYPNDREVLETFECLQTVRFSYRFSHILRSIKALQSSTKTSLRIDEDGLLSLQFLMPSPKPRAAGGTDAFIEFRCLCIDEDT